MGGTDVLTLPMLIAQQVGTSFNPNFAGALGVVLLLVCLVIVIAYNRSWPACRASRGWHERSGQQEAVRCRARRLSRR